MSKFCSNCGSSVADDLRVCTCCGAEVDQTITGEQTRPQDQPDHAQGSQQPYGQPGSAPYGQQPYGQPGSAPYGQQPYGHPGYAPYGHSAYPPYGQPVYPPQPPQPVYVIQKPVRPGRGIGIASMVLGIIGLFYSIMLFAASLEELMDTIDGGRFGGVGSFFVTVVMFSSMSIMGVVFGMNARKKGYDCGVNKSGFIMGAIGVALYSLAFIFAIISIAIE